jgi:hypothetical protein
MAMSDKELQVQDTQHAFLVAWGWFAESVGLIQALQNVPLRQKRYRHRPQSKVLESLVAILAGLEHLQDISLAAHPLDQDQAVAAAWGQPAWADYSGVSRTLSALSWDEARAVARALEEVSHPLIQGELDLLRVQGQRLRYDGDLTGLPVSSSSRTYPNATFGHMDDEIRLGYQAAVVGVSGCPAHTIPGIPYPARRPSRWCARQKRAPACARGGVPLCCASGSRSLYSRLKRRDNGSTSNSKR